MLSRFATIGKMDGARVDRPVAIQELLSTTGGSVEWAAVLESTLPLPPLFSQLHHTQDGNPTGISYCVCGGRKLETT